MSLDDFVAVIAEREGVSFEQALDDVRAVLAMLRETVTDKEFSDLPAELPKCESRRCSERAASGSNDSGHAAGRA